MKKEYLLNIALSAVKFIGVVLALYYSFIAMGIDPGKAQIEAIVIAVAIITPVVLYLFGRTWKKEQGG